MEKYENSGFNLSDVFRFIRYYLHSETAERQVIHDNLQRYPESTLARIRHNESISMDTLNTICKLTGKPVENLIEYKEEK